VSRLEQYGEDDLEQILKIASRRMPNSGSGVDNRQRLLAMADELGISPADLEAAELEYAQTKSSKEERALFDAERRNGFLQHLLPFVMVNLFLAFLSLRKGDFWFLFPLFGWGIGIVSHAASALGNGPSVEAAFQEWRRTRAKIDQLNVSHNVEAVIADFVSTYKLQYTPAPKVDTIAYLRKITGLGLKDAMDAVDYYSNRHPGSII